MIALLHFPEACLLYINSVSSKALQMQFAGSLNRAAAAEIEQTSATVLGRAALAERVVELGYTSGDCPCWACSLILPWNRRTGSTRIHLLLTEFIGWWQGCSAGSICEPSTLDVPEDVGHCCRATGKETCPSEHR